MDRELATKLIIEDRLPLLTCHLQDSYVAIHAKIGGPPGNHKVALELIVEHEDYLESQGFFKVFKNTVKCVYVGEGKNGNIEKADLENMISILAEYLEYKREIASMSYESFLEEYEVVRFKRAALFERAALDFDQRQFYSFPEAVPEWDYWLNQPNWTLEEAAALSFGKSPDCVDDSKISSINNSEPSLFIKDFKNFRRRQTKAQISGLLKDPTDPVSFLSWIETNQILLPDKGIRAGLGDRVNLVEEIPSRDHKLDPSETRTQAIHSLYRIILGVIISKYGSTANPHDKSHQADKYEEIFLDIRRAGLSLDRDTLIKYLDRAYDYARRKHVFDAASGKPLPSRKN